jgi:hypothetical protein
LLGFNGVGAFLTAMLLFVGSATGLGFVDRG